MIGNLLSISFGVNIFKIFILLDFLHHTFFFSFYFILFDILSSNDSSDSNSDSDINSDSDTGFSSGSTLY